MTREEIKNTPELVDFMLDESIVANSREKLRKRLEEVCNLAIKALEQESTTKENLGVDKEQLKTMIRGLTKWYVKRDNTEVGEPNTAVGLLYDDVMFGIDRLPSVTPQEPILDQITEIIEPLRHLPIGEMSDIEWDILRVIDKYKGENEE